MLFKLSARNVKRQISNYLIYFITVSLTIALVFAVNNMIFSDVMTALTKQLADFVQPLLLFVSGSLCIIIAFVLSYATSFLLRRRKKEFGLYLTMGMSRKDILLIFAGETAITFAVSLLAGILLGMALYQVLMLIFVNFLEMQYTVTGYSVISLLITVGSVVVMFLISSLASLGKLRFSKISTLLQGEKRHKKTAKLPALIIWGVVGAAALAGLIISVNAFINWYKDDFWNYVNELLIIISGFVASVILLPTAVAKSFVSLLNYAKPLTARGTGAFTVRQLSGRLNGSSVMIGVLTLLLTFAILGPNVFLTISTGMDISAANQYPYDIKASRQISFTSGGGEADNKIYDFAEELKHIREKTKVKEYLVYTVYEIKNDQRVNAVTESDFIKLSSMLGYKTPELDGGYVACEVQWTLPKEEQFKPNEKAPPRPIELGGRTYECKKYVTCLDMLSAGGFSYSDWYVIPDEAADAPELKKEDVNLAVTLYEPHYDARALYKLINTSITHVTLREYERLDDLSGAAIFLLGDLFISATFILLTVAMLALKILSTVSEDKERYKTLKRLGASDGMLQRSLFTQIFFYYFSPFALPLILCIPFVPILSSFINAESVILPVSAIAAQVAGFAGIIIGLFAAYFAATFFIARRDIKKSIG